MAARYKVEIYTTAGRPTYGTAGRLIWNTTTSTFQRDTGSAWEDLSLGGMSQHANEYHDPDMALATHDHTGVYEPAGVVSTHEGAADPHTGYQKESERAAANGYASLDSSTLVPAAQLATGTPDGTKFLRDDRTWQAVAGGSVGFALAPASNTTIPAGNGLVVPGEFTIVDTYELTVEDGGEFAIL